MIINYTNNVYASIQSGKILTGELSSVQNFKKPSGNMVPCGVVFYGDIKVIIPIALMNISRPDIKVVKSMIGAKIDFLVKELDIKKKLASASRKDAMEVRRTKEFPRHKVKDKISVRVSAVGLNSIIVEALGVETTVAKEYVDWGYIQNLSDVIQIGDVRPAIITEMDAEKGTILVSLKDATEDPYLKNVASLEKGDQCLAVVTGVQDFGVFLEIKYKKGVSALCPFPKWNNFYPKNGDEYLIRLKSINTEERKINASFVRLVRTYRQ